MILWYKKWQSGRNTPLTDTMAQNKISDCDFVEILAKNTNRNNSVKLQKVNP